MIAIDSSKQTLDADIKPYNKLIALEIYIEVEIQQKD